MVELTMNQIVKIVIAVLVFVVMVVAVAFVFRDFIVPYFQGIGPSENSTLGMFFSLLENLK